MEGAPGGEYRVFAQSVNGCQVINQGHTISLHYGGNIVNGQERNFILKAIVFFTRLILSSSFTVSLLYLGANLPEGVVVGNNRFWDIKYNKYWDLGCVKIGNTYYLRSGWPACVKIHDMVIGDYVRFFLCARPNGSLFNLIQYEPTIPRAIPMP